MDSGHNTHTELILGIALFWFIGRVWSSAPYFSQYGIGNHTVNINILINLLNGVCSVFDLVASYIPKW